MLGDVGGAELAWNFENERQILELFYQGKRVSVSSFFFFNRLKVSLSNNSSQRVLDYFFSIVCWVGLYWSEFRASVAVGELGL